MGKGILLYGLNYSPELTGIGKYSGEMAPFFAARGSVTHVVTTPPYYPDWRVHDGFKKYGYSKETHTNLHVYRCPFYVPAKPTTLRRLIHLGSHALSSFPVALYLSIKHGPQVVVTVQPTMFAAPFALVAARLCGAKAVMHIQDFELDAMLGLEMVKDGFLARLARRLESCILKQFDRVSTISFSMMEKAAEKGVDRDKLLFFPNWADTEFVTPEADGSVLRKEWGFSEQDQVVLYAGNIGKKQGLEVVLEAANALRDQSQVKFVLVGTGAHVQVLQSAAQQKGLTSLFFKPLQPWERVPEMLAMADLHLVVQKKGAADVVLPSKLTNILSAGGHTLVTAEPDTELGRLAERFPGIYRLVQPEDSAAFIQALSEELSDMERISKPNSVARNYAVEYLNKEKVLARFEQDLKNLVGSKAAQ